MKKLLALLLILGLLTGCAAPSTEEKKYNATFLTLFDTVTTVVGWAESEEAFTEQAQQIHDDLLVYHRLFDIYTDYEGLCNLKTVNALAASGPVEVDPILIDLLLDCKEYYVLTGGKVNAAMGSVLSLWHEARNDSIDDPAHAYLPDMAALEEAAMHMNFDNVIIDEEKNTVFFSDPLLKLDVGAIAKGWATQRVAENAPAGLLISVGGNVCSTAYREEKAPWVVGVNDPDGGNYLHTLTLAQGSLVTSGDYQRYFLVEGKPYHHIIDPETLMPSAHWRSVTILCEDSGLADALSTALFLLPMADGQALLDKCGAEAMWVNAEEEEFFSPGFSDYIRS